MVGACSDRGHHVSGGGALSDDVYIPGAAMRKPTLPTRECGRLICERCARTRVTYLCTSQRFTPRSGLRVRRPGEVTGVCRYATTEQHMLALVASLFREGCRGSSILGAPRWPAFAVSADQVRYGISRGSLTLDQQDGIAKVFGRRCPARSVWRGGPGRSPYDGGALAQWSPSPAADMTEVRGFGDSPLEAELSLLW